ncbi:MAG: tryptophan synthase subunit alpha [Chloroflexota bacterium]
MTGINRILAAFEQKETTFMPYVPLGYPTIEESKEVVRAVVKAGADLVEIGIPFSDPLADGPTIQAATQKALENGTTLEICFKIVKELRAEGIDTPFMMMGYMNPFLAYGLDDLKTESLEAGVDGFIVPDLPPEESTDFEAMCQANEQAFIHFLAPTSTDERIALVADRCQGFVYLVSLVGITGARSKVSDGLAEFVARVRAVIDTPLAVGFGIGDGEQAKMVGEIADGVIVGSALVKKSSESVEAVEALASEIAEALQ